MIEGGDLGTARSWRSAEVVGYDSGFRRELEAFHSCATTGAVPATSGHDGLADIALCESIIACHRLGRPIRTPPDRGVNPTSADAHQAQTNSGSA